MIHSSDVFSQFSSNLILRISCCLSILGSLIVMLACSVSDAVRKKKGRQLIFWLSVTDLGTSVVYLLSSFETRSRNTDTCKTLALLGIFFPVASFLWTNFIAYHIYTVITSRKLKTEKEWNRFMVYFHIIAWGIGALCIGVVAGFNHAGRIEDEDSGNTGGWCWVQTTDPSNLIWWELIGGKFVEWTSMLIVLPFLYYSTAVTLVKLDKMNGINSGQQQSTASTSFSMSFFSSARWGSRSNSRQDSNSVTAEGQQPSGVSASRDAAALTREVHHGKFRKFYMKMALVPILFFFARLWGSLRIFIYAVTSDGSSATSVADKWLFVMQVIFDPAQGFLNAIVFVFLSSRDIHNLKMFVRTSWPVEAILGPLRVNSTSRDGPPNSPGTFKIQENVSAIYLSEMNSSVMNGGVTVNSGSTGGNNNPHLGGMGVKGGGGPYGGSGESCMTEGDRVSESATTIRGSLFADAIRDSFDNDDEF